MLKAKAGMKRRGGPCHGLARGTLWCLLLPAHLLCGEPVTGRVSDTFNTPLGGATVILRAVNRPAELHIAKTNKDGVYEFREVPDGTYWLEASMAGYVSVRYHPVRILYPFGYEQDFRLPRDEVYEMEAPDKAHVAGELRPGGNPLGGVQVCLGRGREEHFVTANRLGQYSLLVAPGRWRATVKNRKEILWRQDLALGRPGEYRNAIRIRPPTPPVEGGKPKPPAPEGPGP